MHRYCIHVCVVTCVQSSFTIMRCGWFHLFILLCNCYCAGSMFRWTGFAPSNVALMKEIEVWARLNKVLLLALKSSVQLFAVELG